ncbi:MAG: response regulator transcription factor [Chloroflexi bacterium]|nr:response regulator transcription factor [Chloroflexota bacterium]
MINKIQVLVVSQQSLFRQGVESSLASIESLAVSGTTDFNDGVLSAVDESPPDVAIIDIDGPSENGLMLARRIKQHLPSIAIIAFTSNPSDTQLFQALKAQVSAFLNKEATADQLVDAIRRVANGEHPINESLTARPNVATQVLRQFQELSWRNEADGFISPLTGRETEILNYIAQGFLNKEIAIRLGISEQTIKNHVTSILRKLNANARTEAVVVAIKRGLISIAQV